MISRAVRKAGSGVRALQSTVRRLSHAVRGNLLVRNSAFTPVFICGLTGGGTSLVTRLFEQYYRLNPIAMESALNMPRRSPLRIRPTRFYPNLAAYRQAILLPQDVDVLRIRHDLITYYQRVLYFRSESSIVIDKSANTHLVRARHLREAMPSSRFLLIIRDPLSSIEGLRRKWGLFATASLEDVCNLWKELYLTFLRDTASFRQDVIPLLFDDLLHDPDQIVGDIATALDLHKREEIRLLPDRPMTEGRGLRNVVGGRIYVDGDRTRRAVARLDASTRRVIVDSLSSTYDLILRNYGFKERSLEPFVTGTDEN